MGCRCGEVEEDGSASDGDDVGDGTYLPILIKTHICLNYSVMELVKCTVRKTSLKRIEFQGAHEVHMEEMRLKRMSFKGLVMSFMGIV
ncbi:conserved hypothetical protein [Ricinus communis]|uniref:Uncharacterized protein n=1 Tax=Ricinus communis TaxID=3988 RepID=B9T0K1_RICCO|nr:conserved hypothetical protein [Ricinus communis]